MSRGDHRRVRQQIRATQRPGPATLATRHDLRLAIVTWIERTYHRRRRQQRLGRLTLIEFETINQPAHAA